MQGKTFKLECESNDNPPPVKYNIIKVGAAGEIKSFPQRINLFQMSSNEEGEYKCVTENARGTTSQESEAIRVALKSKFFFYLQTKNRETLLY